MFFVPVSIGLQELADRCESEIHGSSADNVKISGAAPIEAAKNGDVTFIDNPKYLKYMESTAASAIFCHEKYLDQLPEAVVALTHPKPYHAYAAALGILYPTAARPQPVTGETGISKQAFVSEEAVVEPDVIIEAGAVVGPGAGIGSGSAILAGAVIGRDVQIGRNTTICSNATVVNALVGDDVIVHNGVQIGQDGFGFAMNEVYLSTS